MAAERFCRDSCKTAVTLNFKRPTSVAQTICPRNKFENSHTVSKPYGIIFYLVAFCFTCIRSTRPLQMCFTRTRPRVGVLYVVNARTFARSPVVSRYRSGLPFRDRWNYSAGLRARNGPRSLDTGLQYYCWYPYARIERHACGANCLVNVKSLLLRSCLVSRSRSRRMYYN